MFRLFQRKKDALESPKSSRTTTRVEPERKRQRKSIVFLLFRPVLIRCQSQAPFLEAHGVKSRMERDARYFHVLGKILKHNVAR